MGVTVVTKICNTVGASIEAFFCGLCSNPSGYNESVLVHY